MQDFDFIETPENVLLQRRLAGIGSRFLAGLLDHLVILGVIVALTLAVSLAAWSDIAAGNFSRVAWLVAVWVVAWFLLTWGYFVFFEMRTNGQSPGKKAMKVRVVKEGGGAITFVDVAIRNLLRAVDILPIAYGVGGVSMFVASKCQRLGDLAAGTVVVLEVVSDYSAHSDHCVQAEWDRQASAEALRATGLSPQEFRALYNYYMRRNQLSLRARQSLLPRLLAPVLQRRGETLTTGVLEDMESYVDLVIRQAYQAESQAAAGERQPRPPGAAEGRT